MRDAMLTVTSTFHGSFVGEFHNAPSAASIRYVDHRALGSMQLDATAGRYTDEQYNLAAWKGCCAASRPLLHRISEPLTWRRCGGLLFSVFEHTFEQPEMRSRGAYPRRRNVRPVGSRSSTAVSRSGGSSVRAPDVGKRPGPDRCRHFVAFPRRATAASRGGGPTSEGAWR